MKRMVAARQYLALVSPELRKKCARWRKLVSAAAIGFAAAFLCFILAIYLGGHRTAMGYLFGISGGIALISVVLALLFYEKTKIAAELVAWLDEIGKAEKLSVAGCGPDFLSETERVLILRKLIETGNLPGYELREGELVRSLTGEENGPA